MKLSDIRAPKGANRDRKRIGRGYGSGQGQTAGKGHKGQRARSGGKMRASFEGGQMPLHRRLPKFGFTPKFPKVYAEVKLSALIDIQADVIDLKALTEAGLIRGTKLDGVKILGNGEIERAVTVRVEKVTDGARRKIEAAGGKVELIELSPRPMWIDAARAAKLKDEVIDIDALKRARLVPEGVTRVHIVKRGILKTAKTFRVFSVSRQARRAIEAVGGKIEEIR
ncbi:MAG: 50S ribosomal protein L15 [Myxococcales bacterium]|nr:MAG: 50S ribosomal protein L15 [Myxococcales bacterium]